jgi:hypothetical protein
MLDSPNDVAGGNLLQVALVHGSPPLLGNSQNEFSTSFPKALKSTGTLEMGAT